VRGGQFGPTRARWQIPNNVAKEANDVHRRASVDLWKEQKPDAVLRSITATYNCVGMVVASRRTHVHPDHLRRVLRDDQFTQVARTAADVGDVVV
jgi:hypothetical protein